MPARPAITSNDAPPPSTGGDQILTLTKSSLYAAFQRQTCGNSGCHGDKGDPLAQSPDPFQVTADTFDRRPTLGAEALERILSSDPDKVMPPGSGDGSKRGETNPVRQLGERLLAWQQAGFPESFTITLSTGTPETPTTDNPYLLSPALGKQLTNIGSCVPNRAVTLNPLATEMQDKDALFASIAKSEDLPDTIYETDLVSLDSNQLAKRGVFSYAPTYPLYSDHAGKMRYVRVPVGKSIKYNAETRDFDIPDNTRFYKTFLKEVIDKKGDHGNRKMETRLIVVRRDAQLEDGSFQTRALRASYAWDKDEQMAHRVKDPFNDESIAADRMCPYVVDESQPRDETKNPISKDSSGPEHCTYMTDAEEKDVKSGLIRHYAIPSTQRCDQCHMGSPNHSYILGFNPWQVDRRKSGEGGIYEEPKEDELTQLQRFLDYGVITGIKPGQAKLEESQLIADPPRAPRNEHELQAQGYMIGNCAFCHNPNGFPVVQNPVLKSFEMYPSKTGGIFQFPLEKYSPRAKAGGDQTRRIPYITTSFGDIDFSGSTTNWHRAPKTFGVPVAPLPDTSTTPEWNDSTYYFTFLGPWRSLIWRNVYTPFTYEEDGTVFVHMPRNVAGFDCRAQKIMAHWMLSIPTLAKKNTEDVTEQPEAEVSATDPKQAFAHGQAVNRATFRLRDYDRSVTGSWCPEDDDIVDKRVILSPTDVETGKQTITSPPDVPMTGPPLVADYPNPELLLDTVPNHAHWVPTDTTDPADHWSPRRGDWKKLIATREDPPPEGLGPVIDHLQSVRLSPELEEYALERLPMGTYDFSCNDRSEISSEPIVADMADDQDVALHRWLVGGVIEDDVAPQPASKVHLQSRGEAVFRAICQNCHGKAADSKSPLAATILELTGGKTRVANFVGGLFGPPSAPGAFAREEFLVDLGATPEDWQARYVLFMGLGGTAADIPQVVLNLVGTSPFYGSAVTIAGANNPNMLGSAQKLCAAVLTGARNLPSTNPPSPQLLYSTFIKKTAHYELWESLCAHNNDPLVHVFQVETDGKTISSGFRDVYRAKDEGGSWVYPNDWPVGNQRGLVERGVGTTGENTLPWCVRPKSTQDVAVIQEWASKAGVSDELVPICPESLFAEVVGEPLYNLALTFDGALPGVAFGNQALTEHWIRQGAINAGLSAFEYLRSLTKGEITPSLPYDFCRE